MSGLALFLVLSACGGGDSAPTEDLVAEDLPPRELVGDEDTTQVEPESVWTETEVVSWSDSGQTRKVAMRYFRPEESCTEATPCPLVVLIPDHLEGGLDTLSQHGIPLARALQCVVVVFNAPGRGTGYDASSGEEDFNGTTGQDSLVRVIKEASMVKAVDPDRVGIVSIGFGTTMAAGALGRFHETGLAEVDFLIDVEGPTNRCFMSQSPFLVNEAEGWYINEDGDGWQSPGRCDFDLHPRKEKFPAGTSSDGKGTDGTPNSYICNDNAFPLVQAGVTCDDDDFFNTREPKILLNKMGVHYLRLQFLYDHEQPTRLASLEAIHFATTNSNLLSVQLNNLAVDQPNLSKYSEQQLLDAKAFLTIGGVGNGFGTDVYAESGFSAISSTELWQKVLPAYIKRMQQRSK